MQSAGFEELATLQGVSGIKVGSYTGQFTDLTSYVDASKDAVTQAGAPVVIKQPRSSAVLKSGSWFIMASAAKGTPVPSVRWEVSKDDGATWTAVKGQTHVIYLAKVSKKDDGNEYRAVFTNSAGTTYSSVTELTVK